MSTSKQHQTDRHTLPHGIDCLGSVWSVIRPITLARYQTGLSCSLDDMVKAGWELYDHLEALSDGGSDGVGLRPELASMNAVANQRMRLALLAKAYAERAVAFIAQQLDGISAASMQLLASLHGAERCSVPDHSDVREQTEALTPLLHVVRSLQPDCLDALGQRYTLALNTLLRKELRQLYLGIATRRCGQRCHITPGACHPPRQPQGAVMTIVCQQD